MAKKPQNSVKLPFRKIYDKNDKVIGGINKNSICDANGQSIATLSGITEVANEKGKKSKVKEYSSDMGTFKASGGEITLNGAPFGAVNNSWIVILVTVCSCLLILSLILTTVLGTRPWVPSNEEPIIAIGDGNGPWGETIEMLPDTIYPGGDGEYEFTLTNPHDYSMRYEFDLTQMYNNTVSTRFPIEFRYMREGQPLTEHWMSAEELNSYDLTHTVNSGDTLRCGIQWRWKFESGNDALDTFYGVDNGEYYIHIQITNTSETY